jgi:hypothetical protein
LWTCPALELGREGSITATREAACARRLTTYIAGPKQVPIKREEAPRSGNRPVKVTVTGVASRDGSRFR